MADYCHRSHHYFGWRQRAEVNDMAKINKICITAALAFSTLFFCLCSAGADIKPTVLFDQAHGQRFTIENEGPLQLSGLAGVFRKEGFEVRAGDGPITDEALSYVDVLVVSGPFIPTTPNETKSILHFIERGGRLCVMLHIPFPVEGLLDRLNVLYSSGPIRERESLISDSPKDFYVTRFQSHPATNGIARFATYGCWALMNSGNAGLVLAQTSPVAWVDLNKNEKLDSGDAVQSFAVVVAGEIGKGGYIVFGDDAIFQNEFLERYNGPFAKNMVKWLLASIKTQL